MPVISPLTIPEDKDSVVLLSYSVIDYKKYLVEKCMVPEVHSHLPFFTEMTPALHSRFTKPVGLLGRSDWWKQSIVGSESSWEGLRNQFDRTQLSFITTALCLLEQIPTVLRPHPGSIW